MHCSILHSEMGQLLSWANDIADEVEKSRVALQCCPPDHSRRSACLHNLAIALHDRFEQRSISSDLDEAIDLHRAALQLRPIGHSHRSASLDNLANCLRDKFHQRGSLSDLDEAVALHRAALLIRFPGHPDRSTSLNNLAIDLHDRFKQRGVQSDLDEAIELHQAALELRPPGHSDRSMSLNNLAFSLSTRFHECGVQCDLDEAIELHRAALELHPPGHPLRSTSLNNLALGLLTRFQQRGIQSDVDEAIELHRAALELRPPGHSLRSTCLNSLASILFTRFQQRGVQSDLDEAIELYRGALALSPHGISHRSTALNNLATSLFTRFKQRGVQSDVDEAIELYRDALAHTLPGHSLRFTFLNSLALGILTRFEQHGYQSDVDEAIELNRDALALSPPGHSLRSACLNSLAMSLLTRFEQRGVQSDVDEAIELHRAALELHRAALELHRAALELHRAALELRPPGFEQRAVQSDVDEAIELYRDALALSPPGHSVRSMCLNNLAHSLFTRFQQRSVQSNLDEAIELHQAALELRPPGHSDRSLSLSNLAHSLFTRFQQCGVQSDLNEAIELHGAALELRPPGHSDRSLSLDGLAISLLARHRQRGALSDQDEAFRLYFQLSFSPHASSRGDLCAAKSRVASAEEMNHGSSLDAYQIALKFLDQHVALLSSSLRHFDIIKKATSTLAMDAFSCSLRNGASTTAVELVEQGHAVDTGAALAEEFKQLSSHIRKAFDESTEDQSSQIRRLMMQWDDVAAEHGPVIIVNASKYSCDALIILSAHDPVHVPLDITRAEVSELSFEFQSLAEKFGSSNHKLQLVSILRKLWLRIVSPVVKVLRESKVLRGSRIWWCPTAEFTLLPLHSAGPYEQKSRNLSSFYISSYTPTLAVLIRAKQQISRDASTQHFVAIGQAKPIRGKELQCVAPELDIVAQHIASVVPFTSLSGNHATVQGAFDSLSRNQWLHLACHGMPNRQQPFESSFAMRDGPLMIKDIIRSHLQNPEFAFLSACHTTVGDESSPDEAIHLAAAMQFSGFRSVIGSMWSVDDEVARQIVSAFYGYLVDESGRLDCTRAAGALHKAVKSLRKMNIPLEQQIVFVHIGV
ncbi:TPR-like protein [Suillus ampliporus]|nr:TPR-like protein [Suillus ampliporus]